MPILLLGNKDIDLITGKRNITIRKLWKTPLYPGDRLYCYWNILSKEREKLFEAEAIHVNLLTFEEVIHDYTLAKELGYKNSKELEKDLRKSYPNNTKNNDEFQIIEFRKLPVSQWEGPVIDQKNMIIKKADILFDMGKYDQSAICYKAALDCDNNDVYLLNRIGDNLSRLGHFNEALQHYMKAIEKDPNNEYIYNNIAIALINKNDPVKALKANTEALKINSQNTTVLYWRGLIYEMLQEYTKSLKFFDYILKIDDTNPDVWNERGTILNMLGESEEALKSYDKSLELCLDDEENPNTWASKANTLMDLQRYDEAVDCYDKALKLDGSNTIILNNKGVALMELDEFNKARDCFKKVLIFDPDNPDAQILYDVCLENL